MPALAPPRRQRLAGLNSGRDGSLKPLSRPGRHDSACGCDKPTFEIVDSSKICMNCGTEISQSNIVAEVTFGESASGAATIDGALVGEDATHANTLGHTARRLGASTRTREDNEQNGREAIRVFTGRIPIAQNVVDQAIHLWRLAAKDGFTQGRRAEEVAGACLYAACRRDKHNTVLLMDLAEIITINVFALGDTYRALAKKLYLEVKGQSQLVEVEPLILKYASKLEFGAATRQVAEDAVKIIRRMKRDWIVTGRHPAGLCGACIILAARMNNFRRSVREVVFVVKVADLTIAKRLEEFKRTRSSFLTVDEFRKVGNRIKVQHDPPSVYEAKERARKLLEKKRKRMEYMQSKENSVDLTSVATSRQSSLTPSSVAEDRQPSQSLEVQDGNVDAAAPAPKRRKTNAVAPSSRPPRRDRDGFVIPEPPIDPLLLAAANAAAEEIANEGHNESIDSNTDAPVKEKRKPGRPRKDKKAEATPTPIPLSEEDLLAEEELEGEIEEILRNDECISKSKDDIEREKLEERARLLAEQQRAMSAAIVAHRAETQGRSRYVIPDTEIIGEDEFADDPEVQNALLTEEQVRVKEKIWVAHNEDWLRAQQTKQLKRALDDAEGKNKDKGKRKKRGRMGDGSVLEGGTPVESPADANRRMLEKRAPKQFSQRINYAALTAIYNRGTPSEAGTPAPESRAGSVAPSEGGPPLQTDLPTPPATQLPAAIDPHTSTKAPQPENADVDDDPDDYWPDAEESGKPDEDAEEEDDEADYNAALAGVNPYGSDAGGYESDAGGYEEEYASDQGGDDQGFED
ncbi:hypothetical protein AAFC00_006083 [Neodothiora populina]|uniref:Cyclin-like domain-containing protein n=1 Tax=Neodothiora populina TaxID=2781224 RepID=A0ABR3P6U8_9PEZI